MNACSGAVLSLSELLSGFAKSSQSCVLIPVLLSATFRPFADSVIDKVIFEFVSNVRFTQWLRLETEEVRRFKQSRKQFE